MITVHGTSDVAAWLGVTTPAVSNWHRRYGAWPVPPAVQLLTSGMAIYGWLPEQKTAWLTWFRDSAEART